MIALAFFSSVELMLISCPATGAGTGTSPCNNSQITVGSKVHSGTVQ